MSADENKKLMQVAFDALSEGDPEPFLGLLAEDVNWTIMGSTVWSGTYQGKAAVMEDLLGPIFAKFSTQYRSTASRLLAEDDIVVVEARGEVMTTSGLRYDNTYCYVCRFDDGRICEITEYLDTDLLRAGRRGEVGPVPRGRRSEVKSRRPGRWQPSRRDGTREVPILLGRW